MWLRRFERPSLERVVCLCQLSLVSGREYDLALPGGSRAAKASRVLNARLQKRKATR
jgi:hypothetical protein